MATAHDRARLAEESETGTSHQVGPDHGSTTVQAADESADRAPVPMPKADAGRVTSELRQALGSLLWSVHTIRRHQYGALS